MSDQDNRAVGAGPGPDYPSDCELTQGLLERARKRTKPIDRSDQWLAALPLAREVRLLLLDVDGVLTDGTIIYTHGGGESKSFNTQDGFGLRLLQDAGVAVGLITARTSEAVSRRAEELRLKYVYQGTRAKLDVYHEIIRQAGLRPLQTAYMGDDWLDLPMMNRAGLALTPANGVPEVQQQAHYVTSRRGGQGAVREAVDLILEAQGKLAGLLHKYSR